MPAFSLKNFLPVYFSSGGSVRWQQFLSVLVYLEVSILPSFLKESFAGL